MRYIPRIIKGRAIFAVLIMLYGAALAEYKPLYLSAGDDLDRIQPTASTPESTLLMNVGGNFAGDEIYDSFNDSSSGTWYEYEDVPALSVTNGILYVKNTSTSKACKIRGDSAVLDGSTAWEDICDGSWEVNIRMQPRSIPNGVSMWMETGTHYIGILVYQTYITTAQGKFTIPFTFSSDTFYDFKVAHTSTGIGTGSYTLWVDGQLISSGVDYDGTKDRKLFSIGDHTKGVAGNYYDIAIEKVSFHSTEYGTETATMTHAMSTAFAQPFTIAAQSNIVIEAYATVSNGPLSSPPKVSATLFDGTNEIIQLEDPTFSNGALVWSGALLSEYTVASNNKLSVKFTNEEPLDTGVLIEYDGAQTPSKILLPTDTVIELTELGVYSAPYPGGTLVTTNLANNASYIRVAATDPFGVNDITGAEIRLSSGGPTQTVSLAESDVVSTSGAEKIYQYEWTPSTGGFFDVEAEVFEGTENEVSDTDTIDHTVISYYVAGRVWLDDNKNNVQDDDENTVYTNLTVMLQDSTGSTIGSVSTGGDGKYELIVVEFDQYQVAFDFTSGTNAWIQLATANVGSDDEKDSDAVSGSIGSLVKTALAEFPIGSHNDSLDVGIQLMGTTFATLDDVWAENRSGEQVICWKTSAEHRTAGFVLYEVDDATGAETALNDAWVTPSFNPNGGRYEYPILTDHEQCTVRLEEIEMDGNRRDLGIYALEFEAPRPAAVAMAEMAEEIVLESVEASEPSDLLEVFVETRGIYGISLQSIATGMGRDLSDIEQLAVGNQLRLTAHGEPVATLYDSVRQRLIFHGESTDNWYAQQQAYQLREGTGLAMATRDGAAASGQSVWPAQYVIEEDVYPRTDGDSRPDDLYYWQFFAGNATASPQLFPIDCTGFAGGDLSVTVQVLGWNDGDHDLEFYFEGQLAGSTHFEGTDPVDVELTIPAEWVDDGENQLGIADRSANGYSMLNKICVSFDQQITPIAETRYVCPTGSVDAAQFEQAIVFELGDSQPVSLSNVSNAWSAAISGTECAVIEANWIPMLEPQAASCADEWMASDIEVDYLVLTSEALRESAQELADYRETQGLRVAVLTYEEICSGWMGGVKTPEAIPEFLRYAQTNWKQAPWMMVIVGGGHYDYFGGYSSEINHVPPMLAETKKGLFSSDGLLADLDGDRRPDLAVGRLPAKTAQDVAAMVGKIKAYEAGFGSALEDRFVFISDELDGAVGEFDSIGEKAASLADSAEIELIALDGTASTTAAARSALLAHLNKGIGMVNYTGHGNSRVLKDGDLLCEADVSSLEATETPAILVALTCFLSRFEVPGENLSEKLMAKADGGAVAIWSCSGYSRLGPSSELSDAFYQAVLVDGAGTLGLAIQQAMQQGTDQFFAEDTTVPYNLLGDPALRIAGNATAQSTDDQFAQWRWQNFSPTELEDDSVSGKTADADADGSSNWEEYVLGASEVAAETTVTYANLIWCDGVLEGEGRMHWLQRSDLTDVAYEVSVSSNLVDWAVAPEALEILSTETSDDDSCVQVTATHPLFGDTLYVRLKISEK